MADLTVPTVGTGSRNPYLDQVAQSMTALSNQNLNQSILPGINSGAVAAGGYGGTRQGIAQGVAIGNAQTGLNNTIGNMYSQDWEQQQQLAAQQAIASQQIAAQRDIANMQNATQWGLGLGSLGLGYTNAMNNYNLGLGGLGISQQNANTNQQYVGSNIYNSGVQGQVGQGQGLYNLGLNQQQSQWAPYANFGNALSQFSGLGGGMQSNSNQGNWLNSLLGGALAASQIGNLFGNGG